MKSLSVVFVLLFCVLTSQAQDVRMAWSKRQAYHVDTIYATSERCAIPDVGHGVKSLQVINAGKVGGGDGYLYVGLITGSTYDTSTTMSLSSWARTIRLEPPGATPDLSWYVWENLTADSLWFKSSDSVKVVMTVR